MSRPPGFTFPLNVAVVDPTAEAEPVVADTDGPPVVNSTNAPSLVPDEFETTRRNVYVVLTFSPLTDTLTGTEPDLLGRIADLRDSGYTQFTIQLTPGHEGAIADWARLKAAL